MKPTKPTSPTSISDIKGVYEILVSPFNNYKLVVVDTLDAFNAVLGVLEIPCDLVCFSVDGNGNGPDATTSALSHTEKPGETYLMSFCRDTWEAMTFAQHAGMIAHEVTHVVDWVFENVGEDKPGMETRAYLVQGLVQFVLTNLWSDTYPDKIKKT